VRFEPGHYVCILTVDEPGQLADFPRGPAQRNLVADLATTWAKRSNRRIDGIVKDDLSGNRTGGTCADATPSQDRHNQQALTVIHGLSRI
jgi:hypothetical protein